MLILEALHVSATAWLDSCYTYHYIQYTYICSNSHTCPSLGSWILYNEYCHVVVVFSTPLEGPILNLFSVNGVKFRTACGLRVGRTGRKMAVISCSLMPITQIVNTSLASGEFPSRFKRAVILPLIKKASLDCSELKNYQPVSNLSFISKVLERVVASRLNTYLSEQSLCDPSQSAYQQHHSVETTLLKVHNNIMLAMDNNDAIMLVLLDLSAAFDTIDHAILLQRVHDEFGIHGTALSWLQSYLQGRSQCVKIQRTLSPATELHFGVPHRSVLGPVLFTLYNAPIGRIIRQHGLEPMFYADDSQLYITFRPAVPGDEVAMVDRITASLSDIRRWMLANMLQLNDNKTECLIICSPRLRSTIHTYSISMGEARIVPAAGARNIWAYCLTITWTWRGTSKRPAS